MSIAATWMQVEMFTVSEISQTKTNIIWYHLYVESKKMQIDLFYKTEIIQWETCHDFSGLNVPLGEKKVKKEKKKTKTEIEIDPWT